MGSDIVDLMKYDNTVRRTNINELLWELSKCWPPDIWLHELKVKQDNGPLCVC